MGSPPRRLRLAARAAPAAAPATPPWPVLVVDDDPQVLAMTRLLLRDMEFEGRGFDCLAAASAAEARAILESRPDIPVMLLDVVMETPDAGLRLVHWVRQQRGNDRLRIILRTGQPGDAPEREVVVGYDINDYKSKTELTAQKLFTALVGALRAWRDLSTIARLNTELAALNLGLEQRVAERTRELENAVDALGRAKQQVETALTAESEAKRQLRQFLSMMSHEFRTPLAVIDSAAQLLRMHADRAGFDGGDRLDTIRGGVQRLLDLIDTCLADEQLESGRIVLHEQAVPLAPLIETALEQRRLIAPDHCYRVEAPAGLAAWADPNLLALVINNLIGNAVKYSPPGSEIAVIAADRGAELALTVADQGIGIPETDLPSIFERFRRAANAGAVAGSGLGLHMVRQIVTMHRGAIEVASRPGEGTRVTVTLPAIASIRPD